MLYSLFSRGADLYNTNWIVALIRAHVVDILPGLSILLRTCVLCHRFRTLRYGMLGQFSGKQKTDGSLDFSGSDRRPFVVVSQTGRFGGNSFKNVIDKRVHDAHGLRGHAGVRMDLLQDFVNVDGVGFLPFGLSSSFLLAFRDGLLGFASLFGRFSRGFGRHGNGWCTEVL